MAFDVLNGSWFKNAEGEEMRYITFIPQFIREGAKYKVGFVSAEFMLYQYIRWCETLGKKKYMYAGEKHLKEVLGFDDEGSVRNALDYLRKKGAIKHIISDKKVYRNKTKVWISVEKLEEMLGGEEICKNVLKKYPDGKIRLVYEKEAGKVEKLCLAINVGDEEESWVYSQRYTDGSENVSRKRYTESSENVAEDMLKVQKRYAESSENSTSGKTGVGEYYNRKLINKNTNNIGDSNESCVCNEDSSRKEILKESEDLMEDKSSEKASLNENLVEVAEGEVVVEEVKGVTVPPANNVGSSPSEEHSLEANESSSKAGLDAEKVNGKGESKKKPRKGNKRVVFNPPSIEEIQEYCDSRNNGLDAEAFWAYYESVGWKVGKNKMKSWKAAVITWERRNREWGNGNQRNQNTGVVRGDAMYEPKPGEDMTYERIFEFWKNTLGSSLPQTVEQVNACKSLLSDIGEEGIQKLIVALLMRGKHSYLPSELTKIKDFVGLKRNVLVVQNFYNQHWHYWDRMQRAAKQGKEVWEVI